MGGEQYPCIYVYMFSYVYEYLNTYIYIHIRFHFGSSPIEIAPQPKPTKQFFIMKCAAAIFLLGSGAASAQADNDVASDPFFPQFQAFLNEHRGGAAYTSEVETIGRFNIFKSNLKLADDRNRRGASNAKLGQPQETHGVTKFMDLTPQEFTAQHKGLIPMKDKSSIPVMLHANAADVKANAQSIDWNSKGVLTPIKNQGQCGSCWAFSATEQLESQYKQKYGTLKVLSPQQVIENLLQAEASEDYIRPNIRYPDTLVGAIQHLQSKKRDHSTGHSTEVDIPQKRQRIL